MNKSIWQQAKMPRFAKLTKPGHFDVVVIGAGITGLSAALFLKNEGKKVCVLERDRIGWGDTGHTTAHLTAQTDLRLKKLAKIFGDDAARLVWQGGAWAIDKIESTARELAIDCQFQRVPGFLHAALDGKKDETKDFQSEAELAQKLGIDAAFVESAPYVDKPGIRFPNQAEFHPLAYLAGLASAVHGGGSVVSEGSNVDEVESEPLAVKAGKLRVECDYLVIATHVPLMGITGLVSATLLQTKIAPYSSYVIAARMPRGSLSAACLWDTNDPYYYLRIYPDGKHDRLIFGGKDHKTGQDADPAGDYADLERVLAEIMPAAQVDFRWSGQVVETNDGLPFIGETADRQFVATGFSGNGMTLGTLSGMMACDAALGRENPWQKLFAVNRKKIRGGTWDYIKENVDYPFYFIKDHLTPAEGKSTRDVKRGEGKILKLDGQSVACSRDEDGRLNLCSAVCTHLGCLVHWNCAEHTWDCPCHGSRFHPDGSVLAGPAETPLAPVKKPAESKSAEKKPAIKPQSTAKTKSVAKAKSTAKTESAAESPPAAKLTRAAKRDSAAKTGAAKPQSAVKTTRPAKAR